MACLETAIDRVAAIKPQAAFFEQQGPAGVALLQRLGRAAIDAGMLVIMDAKRGDVGGTSTAYAAAWIGHNAPFPSDALTINPWLGIETLQPFLDCADATGSGLFILNRTSNPGAADMQDKQVDGIPLYAHLAKMLALAAARTGTTGISSLGIVAGATWPEEARALRETCQHRRFWCQGLVPKAPGQQGDKRPYSYPEWLDRRAGERHSRTDIPPSRRNCHTIATWRTTIIETIAANSAALNKTL